MEDKEITKEESLVLISQMIAQAKSNFSNGHSFFFILWGWVIAIANLGHYVIARFDLYDHPYVVWLLVLPAMMATIWKASQLRRQSMVRGYYDKLYVSIWKVVTLCIFIVLIHMDNLNFHHNPIILLFSAMGTFFSGQILKFSPLKYGSYLLFVSAFGGLMLPVVEQYLVAGLAIIAGYLVPGYLLLKEEQRV